MNLVQELRTSDVASYQNFFRMSPENFAEIERRIQPLIQREDTNFHKAVSPKERLAVTLRYLATGESFKSLSYSFRLGATTIGEIVPDTCNAIYEVLKDDYLKLPQTQDEWTQIANAFFERWNFPHTLSAIDGKHIALRASAKSGSTYYKYKHFFSIVLMALVDADYQFLYIEVGCNDRISDGGFFAGCTLQEALTQRLVNLPESSTLQCSDTIMSYHIIADDAFPLRDDLMKPFPFRDLSHAQRIYNYILSRARRVVENAFGIMASKFRVFLSQILLSPKKAETVVMAACVLHNFLRSNRDSSYIGRGILDDEDINTRIFTPGSWRQGATIKSCGIQHSNYSGWSPKEKRQKLMEYCSGPEGSVAWQYEMI